MDGNGRWAELRRRNRTFGHLRGARIAREIIETCSKKGIGHLTLYAFSAENWLRPLEEVSFLMALLSRHLKRERANLVKNNIRFAAIGDLKKLPASVMAEVDETIRATENCTGMLLTFALSYGGRQEIVEATRAIAQAVARGELSIDQIDESLFESNLQTGRLPTGKTPDPDLIIRTSGESRLSNFLLWQSAYSEILITPTLWPDYGEKEFEEALNWFSGRERRFGKTSSQIHEEHLSPSTPTL
jgi:undecaprenyl diphosphate synthase